MPNPFNNAYMDNWSNCGHEYEENTITSYV